MPVVLVVPLGASPTDKALTLALVYANGRTCALPYRELSEAIAFGKVIASLTLQPTGPMVHLLNRGKLPHLNLDVEGGMGGKQNGVVITMLRLPPNTTFDRSMSRVEHKYRYAMQPVVDAGDMAHPRLRRQTVEQGVVSHNVRGIRWWIWSPSGMKSPIGIGASTPARTRA